MNKEIKPAVCRDKVSMEFSQEKDSCDESTDIQSVKIETENAGAGDYYVISTDRWAFDNIDDLVNLLKQVPLRK